MNELTPIPQLKTEIQFYERQTTAGMLETLTQQNMDRINARLEANK